MLVFFMGFIAANTYSQEKSNRELKKELKEKQKLEAQKITLDLFDSKSFVFKATSALPTGTRLIDLNSSNYEVIFLPEIIESHLPFFGRAYSTATVMRNDGGINFKEKPEKYTFEKTNKNFQIKANVKDKNDYYNMYLTIGLEGNASLNISSNNRGSISYNGKIEAVKELKARVEALESK